MSAMYDWGRRHQAALDAGLAVVLWGMMTGVSGSAAGFAAAFLASGQLLPLTLRRSHPYLTFTLVSLTCLAQLFVLDEFQASNVGFLFALYALSAYGRDARVRLAGLGVGLLAAVLASLDWSRPMPAGLPQVVFGMAMLGVLTTLVWVSGDLIRNRRELLANLAAQNEALRRDRDQRAALAAQSERSRIARDMHDIVAHSLAVIVVQADGAAYAAEHATAWDRQRGVQALQTIGDTAREALAETRRLVGVLRHDGDRTDGRSPTASLADLDGLLERVRTAGATVELTVDGAQRPLARDVEIAAYRIIQEALTNVLKHAGARPHATVALAYGTDLTITVSNDGAMVPPVLDATGNGLIGMRERALALGGALRAGPRAQGGFVVSARLPMPAVSFGAGRIPAP